MRFSQYIFVINLFVIHFNVIGLANNELENDLLTQASKYLYNNTDSSLYFTNQLLLHTTDTTNPVYAKALLLKGKNQAIMGETNNAFESFNRASNIFKLQNNIYELLQTQLNIAELYYNWGEYPKAKELVDIIYSETINYELDSIEVICLNYLGKYYHSIGDFNKSIEIYEDGLKLSIQINDTLQIIAIQNKIGKHYETIGNYSKAIEYYFNSEKLIQGTDNIIEISTTYNHLGNIYHKLNEIESSKFFHSIALEKRRSIGYLEGEAKSLKNLGEVLIEDNKYDSAMLCFRQSLAISKSIGYTKGMIKSIHNIGVIQAFQKQFHKAILNFNRALNLSNQIGYDKGVLNAYYQLAKIYYALNAIAKSLNYANKGLELAHNSDVITIQRDLYFLLSEIYENEKDYVHALENFKLFNKTNNEILNLESNKRIAELESKFTLRLAEKENSMLKRDNEIKALKINRKNSLIITISATLILLISLIIIVLSKYKQKQTSNDELQLLNNTITQKNNEYDKLNKHLNQVVKQQIKLFSIIAHELRNPLWWFRNLIQMLTQKIDTLDKKTITQSLNSLNESATQTFHLMDNLLHWSKAQLGNIKCTPTMLNAEVIIKENIALINSLVEFKNIDINYSCPQNTYVLADKNMLNTIIRNLISNAIKFTPNHGSINIKVETHSKEVFFHISDNGIGLNNDELKNLFTNHSIGIRNGSSNETGSGLGLILCKEFIEQNKGKLSVKSKPNIGTTFTFSLPFSLQAVVNSKQTQSVF